MTISAVASDRLGRLYATGSVPADAVTVPAATFRQSGAGLDIYVARFNAAGTTLEYFSIVGGDGDDEPTAITVDAQFRAVIAGTTTSAQLPGSSENFPGGVRGSTDGFVLTLNSGGRAVIGAAEFGGGGDDVPTGVAVDNAGAIFVSGNTMSPDFPTTEGVIARQFQGAQDGFVAKMNLAATSLLWSTYLSDDAAYTIHSLVVDHLGQPILAGATTDLDPQASRTMPRLPATAGSFGPAPSGGGDAFVVKLNSSGTRVVFGGYLGGSNLDVGRTILQDAQGDLFLVGETSSLKTVLNLGVVKKHFPRLPDDEDPDRTVIVRRQAMFLAKISADGSTLLLSEVPDLGSTSTIWASLSGTNTIAVAAWREFGGPEPPIPGDFIPADLLPHQFNPFVYFFSASDAQPQAATRIPPFGRTSIASIASGADGALHLGLGVEGNDAVLSPVTASVPADSFDARTTASLVTLKPIGAEPCQYSIEGLPDSVPPEGVSGKLSITAPVGCAWSLERVFNPGEPAYSIPAAGTGSARVAFTIPANDSSAKRSPYFFASWGIRRSYTQLPLSCAEPVFQPGAIAFTALGGSQELTIQMPEGCPRELSTGESWLDIQADLNGTGRFTATVTAAANIGLARSGLVQSRNSALTVTQQAAADAGCVLTLPTLRTEIGPQGGTVAVAFQLSQEGCAWSAVSAAPWAKIAGVATGQGKEGEVQVLVEPFDSQALRTAKLYLNGVEFQIEQAGFDLALPAEIAAIVDAAAFSDNGLAAEGLATIFGKQLAHAVARAETIPLPEVLGGIRVLVKLESGEEVAAKLLYASPTQVNFVMPAGAHASTEFRIDSGERGSNEFTANVNAIAPRLFEFFDGHSFITAAGYAQLVYPNGTQKIIPYAECNEQGHCNTVPVDRGPEGSELYLVLYGTGFPSDAELSEYKAWIGEAEMEVVYAGRHEDFVGLQQINIRVPRSAWLTGVRYTKLQVRGAWTQEVYIQVEPVAAANP